jgi:hypothetical protein
MEFTARAADGDEKALYNDRGEPRGDGPRCKTCGDLVAWGTHPQCERHRGRIVRQGE